MGGERLKEIEVQKIRAILKCRACGNVQINDEHGYTNIGDRALVLCAGKCQTYNMHTVIAKRLYIIDIGEVEEKEESLIPPMIVDPSVSNPTGMAEEELPEGRVKSDALGD